MTDRGPPRPLRGDYLPWAGEVGHDRVARTGARRRRRRKIFAEGEALLARGAVGHNFIEFYDDAMEACLENGEWDAALGYADRLEDYLGEEPLPFTDLIIPRDTGLALVVPAMEAALVKVDS